MSKIYFLACKKKDKCFYLMINMEYISDLKQFFIIFNYRMGTLSLFYCWIMWNVCVCRSLCSSHYSNYSSIYGM